jgi:hypothetical protein
LKENVCKRHIFKKDCFPRQTTIKAHQKKKKNSKLVRMQKILTDTLPEKIQMANKYLKRCSIAYTIRVRQIKTIMRDHYTPIKMPKIQNTGNTKC